MLRIVSITCAIAGLARVAGAGMIIDFESVPGGTPSVGLEITDQYEADFGVSFSMSDGSAFRLGDYGGEFAEGWIDDNFMPDVLAPGYNRGQFFAAYPQGATPGRFLNIEYSGLSTAAGFDIIDIDDGPGVNPASEEEFTIRVYNGSDTLVHTSVIRAGDPGTGDGIPTRFSVDFGIVPTIKRIEIQLTDSGGSPGMAFDDFTPYTTTASAVPEPSSMALLGMGLAGLGGARWRRRWRRRMKQAG